MWCGDCRRAEPVVGKAFGKAFGGDGEGRVRVVDAGGEGEYVSFSVFLFSVFLSLFSFFFFFFFFFFPKASFWFFWDPMRCPRIYQITYDRYCKPVFRRYQNNISPETLRYRSRFGRVLSGRRVW